MAAINNTLIGTHSSLDHYGSKYPNDMYGCRAFNNIFTNIVKTTGGSVLGYNLNKGTDPLFVDAANNNYRLKSTSPAINAGTWLPGVTTGAVGNPDIGAYEYGGTDWKARHDFTNPPNPTFTDTKVPCMNMVKKAGFETGDLTNWEVIGSKTRSVISGSAWTNYTGNVRSNKYGIRLGGSTSPVGVRQTITGLSPNTTYVASVWLKVENASEKIELGAKTSGGISVTKSTSSLNWDHVTCEFTTTNTDTSATIYLWKYTTGTTYAYGDVFALTPKDPRAKSDSFESGFSDWTHYPYDIPATPGTVTHNGSVSYKVDDDYDAIGKNLRASHNKIVTVWFHDYKTTRDDTMHVIARVDDNVTYKGLGVSTGISKTHYIIRNDKNNSIVTSVARSPGWHEFKFDYTTGKDLKMYIDGTLVSTTKDVTSFNYIMLGDWFTDSKSCTESYFDDLKVLDVDTIQ